MLRTDTQKCGLMWSPQEKNGYGPGDYSDQSISRAQPGTKEGLGLRGWQPEIRRRQIYGKVLERGIMKEKRVFGVMLTIMFVLAAAVPNMEAQFVTRDQRWYTRGPWMWALTRELPDLYIEFNGIDFGHAHLGETLLRTQDQEKVEQARREVLDFIFSRPPVPPDEDQVAPTMTRMIWEVQKTFNLTHSLHRSFYDLYASDKVTDKESAAHKLLADYLAKPEAITLHPLDHHEKLWSFPESKSFRDNFPKFNSQIWAYHWLQGATYDAQLMGGAAKQREVVPKLIEHYHAYLRKPPLEWQAMPMLMESAPDFSMKHPDVTAIFDNLHMLHDNVDDVLSRPDLYPTRQAQRQQILKIYHIYLHRNHIGEDQYAQYHSKMAGMMGQMQMMNMGGGMKMAHGGKGAEDKKHGKEMKMPSGHGAESKEMKDGGKEPDWGRKPEQADWQKKAGHMGMQMKGKDKMGSRDMAGMKGMKDKKGMEGMEGMDQQQMMKQMMADMMKGMGPRPPSARDVIEGKAHEMEHGEKDQTSSKETRSPGDHSDSADHGRNQSAGPHLSVAHQLRQETEPGDLLNHHAANGGINGRNVHQLELAWKLQATDYVTHTPVLHHGRIYFADWGGNVYSADARSGRTLWKKNLYKPEDKWAWHGFAGRGVVADDLLVEASVEGDAYGIDLNTGEVKWKTDFSPENKYGGSFNPLLFHDGLVYIGVSSVEEHISDENPDYKPTFRGKIVALDSRTGKIAWQKFLAEAPDNGVGVWTTFALDTESGTLFATTGNNYTGKPNKYSDALIALDAKTGEIRWSKQVLDRDVWTPAEPIGPDYDFSGGPQLFEATVNGQTRKLIGAGQKSGIYWVFDRENGDIIWQATISYGGVAGGLHGDASIGDGAIYVWGNNYFDHEIAPEEHGMNVVALDAATGKIIWKQAKIQQAALGAAGVLCHDVYLVPSLDGKIHAYQISDGQKIWQSPEVPGPLSSSLLAVDEMVFCTSGMPEMFSYYEGENAVYAYAIGNGAQKPGKQGHDSAGSEKKSGSSKTTEFQKHN